MTFWQEIDSAIRSATGSEFRTERRDALGGGCINRAYRLRGREQDFFVKLNSPERLAMFQVEAQGLQALAATKTVRVPQPICCGVVAEQAYLVLEYLPLRGLGGAEEQLGRQLARLHTIKQAYFGWTVDNTLGTSKQPNPPTDNWVSFWQEQRLGFQLRLAAQNGYSGRLHSQGEQLLLALPRLLHDHRPYPALLHGDLWAGNAAADSAGHPVIFDPACYYGDREADLAMTELFGGFGPRFYAAYREVYPLDAGYPVRCVLYQLYHVLNHLNPLGLGYLAQAERMMERLLVEVNGL